MKKIKAAFAVILAGVMFFTLAACSGSGGYNIPIVCGESGMNEDCGVATYGVNYYNLGVMAADMAADVLLKGKDISAMPVQSQTEFVLTLNEDVAKDIGFTIPDSVKEKATEDNTVSVTRNTNAIKTDEADFTIGILQLVQHVALDKANKAFVDQLSVRMAGAGKTVKFLDKNASGEQSNCVTIASQFVSDNVDLIYAIATPAAQAAAAETLESKIPVIFSAVTDAVEAGLAVTNDAPGKNISGVSDMNPITDQIDLIAELLGKTNITIGFLYTSSETNSVYQVEIAKKYCDEKGYKYETKGMSDINDLENSFIALKKVDAIYIPTDNTLANGVANVHAANAGK